MMRKITSIFALALVASVVCVQAQSLRENSYYKRSLELKAMAEKSFDDGDYDSAAGFAAQASEYASLSDQFVAKMAAKAEAIQRNVGSPCRVPQTNHKASDTMKSDAIGRIIQARRNSQSFGKRHSHPLDPISLSNRQRWGRTAM